MAMFGKELVHRSQILLGFGAERSMPLPFWPRDMTLKTVKFHGNPIMATTTKMLRALYRKILAILAFLSVAGNAAVQARLLAPYTLMHRPIALMHQHIHMIASHDFCVCDAFFSLTLSGLSRGAICALAQDRSGRHRRHSQH
jgi:hypothetical protein